MVATRVFPSPVFISAMAPLCRIVAPITWTSKWRCPIARFAASRTAAYASGSRASSSSPLSSRWRNSAVLAANSSSDRASISGSKSLTRRARSTILRKRLPSPAWRMKSNALIGTTKYDVYPDGVGGPGSLRNALLDVEQALPDGVHHGFHPGVQVQLLQDVADVVLDGVLRDEELLGDVPVVVAPSDELQHLQLPLGEAGGRDAGPLVGALHHAGELVQQLRGHRGGDERLPGIDRPDGVGDLLDRDLLEQVARGPRLDGVVQVGLLVGDRQHQDLGVGEDLLDGPGCLQAGALRHADVHEDDVGHGLLCLGEGLGPVAGLADDVDVLLDLQDHLQPTAEQRVVVDDDHADRLRQPRPVSGLYDGPFGLLLHRCPPFEHSLVVVRTRFDDSQHFFPTSTSGEVRAGARLRP